MQIVIIDIGIGNITSVKNWLGRLLLESVIVSCDSRIPEEDDSILVFPGVGDSVEYTRLLKSWPRLTKKLQSQRFTRVIGICAGYQALCSSVSENGRTEVGLGLIPAISTELDMLAPHNGWESVDFDRFNVKFDSRYRRKVFFNHSCGVVAHDKEDNRFDSNDCGYTNFYMTPSVFGLQFHPEKSGVAGNYIGKFLFHV
jgi:imidazole glycerol-phosphate synthase subunit HisH